MTKSQLKQLIRECIREVNETTGQEKTKSRWPRNRKTWPEAMETLKNFGIRNVDGLSDNELRSLSRALRIFMYGHERQTLRNDVTYYIGNDDPGHARALPVDKDRNPETYQFIRTFKYHGVKDPVGSIGSTLDDLEELESALYTLTDMPDKKDSLHKLMHAFVGSSKKK